MSKKTKEEEEEIINKAIFLHFNEKKSLREISKILNIHSDTLSLKIRKKGLKIIRHGWSIYTEELIEKIKFLHFKEKWSLTRIKDHFNLDRDTLRKELKKRGINYINYQNKLNVRENLFEKINSEEDAYWLGFIYADGYISDGGRFELSLNYLDYPHLIKFAKYCEFDLKKVIKKQVVAKKCYRCRLAFAAQYLKENFNKCGIIPRKSLILKFPNENILPSIYLKDFLRGYVDGDGSFNVYNRKNKNITSFSLLGTKEFLTKVKEIFNSNVELFLKKDKNIRNIHKDKNHYEIQYSGESAKNILKWLYKDSRIFLDRKYKTYKNKIAV